MVNDQLVALTKQGLHRYDTTWTALTEDSYNILDLATISYDHWIVSVKEPINRIEGVEEAYESFFIETQDAGETWQIIEDNFGGENYENESANTLIYDQESEKLYATGYDVIASSTDFGQTWIIEEGQWGMISSSSSILMHDANQDIWYGGQNAIEEPVLNQFNFDTYELTMHGQAVNEFLPSPSVIKQLLVDPKNSERLIASGEGGIVHTNDYGETWSPLLTEDNYRFHFSPVFDPIDNNTIYTAGWNKAADEQPLILQISRDNGTSWQSYTNEKEEFQGGVRSMLAVEAAGKTELYIGLYAKGVVKVSFD
jgi:photosystem II stability/assembly factor-like uncharacterized protein